MAQLCPDGVQYVPLSSVCVRQKGIPITAGQMKGLHNSDGEVCVFAGGNTKSFMNVRDLPRNAVICKPSIIVKSRGNIGFEYYDKPFTHKNELWSYSKKSDTINLKFIYYYLDSHKKEFQLKAKPDKLPQISISDTDNYKIPLASLVIQDEIIRIIDSFIELTTELTKRKEQYQYYINTLFQFDEDYVEWKSLEELGSFIRGKRFTKDDYVEGDGISAIHYGEIYTNYGTSADNTVSKVKRHMVGKLRYASPSDVVFTDVGETVEDVGKAVAWLGDDKVAIHDHCYAFKHKMNPKYISYYMQTDSFISQKIKYVVRT